jgi:hypothetical protein
VTVKRGAVEATCRRLMGNPKLLKFQFRHNAAAGSVSVEVPNTDRFRAKVSKGVTNSGVRRLRRHALSGVFRHQPKSGLIDVWLLN